MASFDAFSFAFSRWFLRHRVANLLVIAGLTVFFGWKATELQVFSQFVDLLPRQHPFVQVYERYNRDFGSANLVFAALVSKSGSVYDERFLEKLFALGDQVDKIEGVDHDQVTSLTHAKVRDQAIDEQGTLLSTQIVGEEAIALLETQFFTRRAMARARERDEAVPRDLAELRALVQRRNAELDQALASQTGVRLELLRQQDPAAAERLRALRRERAETTLLALRLGELSDDYRLEGESLRGPEGSLLPAGLLERLPERIRGNRLAHGRLVSWDETSALVMAGFLEGRIDYEQIFRELRDLQRELEADGVVEVHLTGMPVLAGWCFEYAPEILWIIGLTLAVLALLLGIYFRQWYGVVIPFSSAVVSAIWGLGFISLMDYQLEPLVLVIPMLITARAVSHSVQFVERFYEEYERLRNKDEAVITSMANLLLPGTLAIVTDALGIYVIGICSIALMKKVATFGAFWALSLLVTGMLLNRLLISFFPAPRSFEHYTPAPIARLLRAVARWATGPRHARVVFAVWLVVFVGATVLTTRVRVGEYRPGTPILWPDSEFNRSVRAVAEKFHGVDDLVVVVETEQPFGIHRPESMREIEIFQRYMEQGPKAAASVSIVDYLKAITRTFHFNDPRWYTIPYTGQEIGGLLYLYEAGSPDPRVLSPYRDERARNAAVRIFYDDHQGETIDGAIARAQRWIEEHPTGRVSIRLDVPRDDWLELAHRALGPLLPPRGADLVVQVRDDGSGRYARREVARPDREEAAPPDSSEWILTLPRMTRALRESLLTAGYDGVQKIADADVEALARVQGYDLVTAYQLRRAAKLDRRAYAVRAEWRSPDDRIHAEIRRRGLYENPELWVRFESGDFEFRPSGTWSEGPSFALASGLMGVLAASNDEVERSNNAMLIACFTAYFVMIFVSYRSLGMAVLMITSLGTAALVSMAFMWFTDMGFDVNTLPVQALGVGIGDDYALYIMDRVVRERKRGHDLLEAVRIAIGTTGMAIFFTGTTLVGGIVLWYFISSLRFAADMSLLLSILLVANLIGAILLIPAFTTLFRPRFVRREGEEV
jgi:predicted RND superfamily exporter protein